MSDKNSELLDIKSSYIFKLVLSKKENKDILLSLVNKALPERLQITKLEVLNAGDTPNSPKKDPLGTRISIKARTAKDKWMLLDMRTHHNTGDVDDRNMYFQSYISDRESKRSFSDPEKIYPLGHVVSIWFMVDNFLKSKDYKHDSCFMYKKTELDPYEVFSDYLWSVFFELPKFDEKSRDKSDLIQSFLTFLKNPMDESLKDIKEIQQLYNTLKKVSADKKVRAIYLEERKAEEEMLKRLKLS